MIKPFKIKLEESGLPYRKNYEQNSITIAVDEHFIRSHYMIDCEHCDDELGNGSWKRTTPNWRITYNRSCIVGVGLHYTTILDCYTVTIYINGSQDDLDFSFADGEQAYSLFKQLEDLHVQYMSDKPFVGQPVE